MIENLKRRPSKSKKCKDELTWDKYIHGQDNLPRYLDTR